jgi:hypothetical protein
MRRTNVGKPPGVKLETFAVRPRTFVLDPEPSIPTARFALASAQATEWLTKPEKTFDLWWEWATKDRETSYLTISSDIHNAVMALPPDERGDREKVNEAVRNCLALGPLRPAGSEDQCGVPKTTE